MSIYQIVLFDLDGTLSDPKEGITKSVQYALQKLGQEESDLAKLERFIGPPLQESFSTYYGFNQDITNQAIALYRERFKQLGMFENKLYSNITTLLDSLREKGCILIVATSKPTVFAEEILKYFQIERYFAHIIGSNLDGTRSSKTEIIQYILALYPAYQHRDFVMIGDREQLKEILIDRKRKERISLVTDEEAPIVHKLMLEAFEDYRYIEVPSSALTEPVDKLINALKSRTEQAIIYWLDDIPLGSARLQLKDDSLYFSRLSVIPSARGKGIAKAMLAWMEEYALLNRKQKVECKVRANIPKNIELYEKLGFVITKEETAANPNGMAVKAVYMEKLVERVISMRI